MTVALNNWNKPSNKKLKLIADIMLYSLPLMSGVVIQMPITDTQQKWVLVGINLCVIVFKAITKFTSENTAQNEAQG